MTDLSQIEARIVELPLRAWRVSFLGIDSIVRARSRGAAKSAVVASAQDAGYQCHHGTKGRVVRAPEFDRINVAERYPINTDYAAELARRVVEGVG